MSSHSSQRSGGPGSRKHRFTPRCDRRGYALLWILVFTAIIAAVAAASLPYIMPVNDQARVDSALVEIRAVGAGIVAFEAAVHSDSSTTSNNLPGRLSQLTRAVHATVDRNSCWSGTIGAMTSHDSSDWTAGGPYVRFLMPDVGLWTPVGRLRDSVPQRAANGPMYLEVSGVSQTDMLLVASAVDHGSGDTVSFVYRAPVGGAPDTGTLRFRVLSTAAAISLNKC